ncbi:MAG: hypothetical protein HQL95_10350 [Magnetococcales bacterium]|nr:hypothetical protein [Magnetococcales bacterium]
MNSITTSDFEAAQAHAIQQARQIISDHQKRLDRLAVSHEAIHRQLKAFRRRQDFIEGDTEHKTALAFCRLNGVPASLAFVRRLDRRASKICKRLKIQTGKQPDIQSRC